MEIRKAHLADLDDILRIYEYARGYMIENNNPNQWKKTHPTKEQIIQDIKEAYCYVCCEDNMILGVFYFRIGNDPTYLKIKGSWLNNRSYGVIHRIAVLTNQKGIGSFCINYAFNRCHNLKIDTHRDNLPMQRLLKKLGFHYCGIINLLNGDERLAFQRSIEG